MQNLSRRGGIWWARLVVPQRLRSAVGRREFTQSCKTHDIQIAKLVAAHLLARWRSQLITLESRPMTVDVLKIVDGSPEIAAGGWLALGEAAEISGMGRSLLMGQAAIGVLQLHAQLLSEHGHIVEICDLELVDPIYGPRGGLIAPTVAQMPAGAIPFIQDGVLPLSDSTGIASAIKGKKLEIVQLVMFKFPARPGAVFVPSSESGISLNIDQLVVAASEIEVLRTTLKSRISPEAVERVVAERNAASARTALELTARHGKRGNELYSAALDAYATTASGIPGQVASKAEQLQKCRGCNLFVELVGDLPLREVTADRLREFRELLKGVPSKVNNIPKTYRRATMVETVAALEHAGIAWPMMTESARHERLLWIDQMFRWLVMQDWVNENPMTSVIGEQTKTALERKAERHAKALRKARGEDDSDDREPFAPKELLAIFGVSQYQTGNGSHVVGNERWYPFEYWLPLIAYFAGCRIKEISQLYLSDLRQCTEGTWFFDINEETPDKTLKNENAVRQIPVAPMLIELGLIEYRDKLKLLGYRRLFPELTWATTDARYAKEPIRKMSDMFESLGMPRDGTKVFHCLRANFNDALIRVNLADLPFDDPDLKRYVRLKVFGHKVTGVNELHYTSTTMQEKFALISAFKYALPKITKFDVAAGVEAVRKGLANKRGHRAGREDMGACNEAIYGASQ
jgi:hypothetical protein